MCPHACMLSEGEVGSCGARWAVDGTIEPLNYGRCTSLALDPIEKKPLARYYPGSTILSYGSFGCNLSCSFCQNWRIAQTGTSAAEVKEALRTSSYLSPQELVDKALAAKDKGNKGLALTYNEPLVCPELILDAAPLLHQADLKLVVVTNAYVREEMAAQLFKHIDAANIDLKAFNQEFYTSMGAPAGLNTVKQNIKIAVAEGCHVEVTTLIIPGLNDSAEEMEAEAQWLATINPNIPLHINRFFPAYRMQNTSPTPLSTLDKLERIARRYLAHVYTGNR